MNTKGKKPPKVYKLKGPNPKGPGKKPSATAQATSGDGDFITVLQDVFVETAVREEDEHKLSQAKERFYVRDRRSAAWAAGKIAMWQNEIERRKLQARDYVLHAEKTLDRLKWLFWESLKEWARRNLDYNKKSVILETATLQFRDTQPRLEVVDEEALKKWALVNFPDAIESVEKVLLDPLKEFWTQREIVPEGTKAIPKGESFTVKG